YRVGGRSGPAFDPRANAGIAQSDVRCHSGSPTPPALQAGQSFGRPRRRACLPAGPGTATLLPAGHPLLTGTTNHGSPGGCGLLSAPERPICSGRGELEQTVTSASPWPTVRAVTQVK